MRLCKYLTNSILKVSYLSHVPVCCFWANSLNSDFLVKSINLSAPGNPSHLATQTQPTTEFAKTFNISDDKIMDISHFGSEFSLPHVMARDKGPRPLLPSKAKGVINPRITQHPPYSTSRRRPTNPTRKHDSDNRYNCLSIKSIHSFIHFGQVG